MSSFGARRSARQPALYAKLNQMTLPLRPLVQFDTGYSHPEFPRSMLQFLLLTDEQLESLASFYHQRTPHELHYCYPCPISWPRKGLTVEDKRRKFGKFIGMRGCETPKLPRVSNADHSGCRGDCKTAWDTPISSPDFCYECAMRQIQLILNGAFVPQTGSDEKEAKEAKEAKVVIITTADIRRRVRTRNSSRTRPVHDDKDKTRKPATYALRKKQMVVTTTPPLDPAPTSTSPMPVPQPLTIDEIYERARRARLEDDSNDALTRRKAGHY